MPVVRSTEPDFRVCQITLGTLVQIQKYAEGEGWATRWSSEDALRSQVKDTTILLYPILREERSGAVRAYRCLALFSTVGVDSPGGLTTIDVSPEMFNSLDRIDRDPDVRTALVRVFSLASGGIASINKD